MENQSWFLKRCLDFPVEILRFLANTVAVLFRKMRKISALGSRLMVFFHVLVITLSLLVLPSSSSQAWGAVIITQANFQGLQAFKRGLTDPMGFLRSWNDSGLGACSGGWTGIKCAKGQVIVIQLPWRGLGGRITEKIGQLQALRKLSLHDNEIGGSIPSSLGLIPNLRGVQLFNNRLSGSIPPSLGSSPSLQSLDLGNNSLTGSIPDSIVNNTKLFWLNLSFNLLSGTIPDGITHSLSLQFVDLRHNNLSGMVPQSLERLKDLQEFLISQNQIGGTIPDDIGKLSRIRALDFSYNAINGSLPDSLSNASSLVILNLEGNLLENPIPESYGRLRNLSVFNLKSNRVSGFIPSSIGNISSLTKLDLSQNQLTGEIPDSLSGLETLNFLNVSYNNLSGQVPLVLAGKFNSSSFIGNVLLCGYSKSTPCPSAEPSPVPEEPKNYHRRKLGTKDVILIASGVLLLVLLILVCILLWCLLRKRSDAHKEKDSPGGAKKGPPPAGGDARGGATEAGGKLVHFDGPLVFTADDLLCATAEVMGKSSYGTVYKATLEDGSQVAVKRLREKISKGQKEFEQEIKVIGRIRHLNLLALRAYYIGPKGEKLLVFDYMPRGSLATFLHAREPDTSIDWPTRMMIAKGMARGLFYLHANENLIHGNLTSSNVLLDQNANPKIADYGLSQLMSTAAGSSVIATAGALGYRAPELSKLKKANTKTDVYSLGVIMLELLTGKSPSVAMNGLDLPQWVASTVKEEWTNEVFDLELMRGASAISDELLNTLKLALNCVDPSPTSRPEVQQVLQQLDEIRPETTTMPTSCE